MACTPVYPIDVCAACIVQLRLPRVLERRVQEGVMASKNLQAVRHRRLLQLPGVRRQASPGGRVRQVKSRCFAHHGYDETNLGLSFRRVSMALLELNFLMGPSSLSDGGVGGNGFFCCALCLRTFRFLTGYGRSNLSVGRLFPSMWRQTGMSLNPTNTIETAVWPTIVIVLSHQCGSCARLSLPYAGM